MVVYFIKKNGHMLEFMVDEIIDFSGSLRSNACMFAPPMLYFRVATVYFDASGIGRRYMHLRTHSNLNWIWNLVMTYDIAPTCLR